MNRQIVMVFIVIVILLTVFSVSHLSAATYYVSSSAGNDSNSGTSPSYAWKSISKVNSFSFRPGDSILFKTDDTWSNTLLITASGTKDNRITFGAYGSGAAPIIDATGLNWGINSSGKDFITITGLEIKNSIQYGIRNRGGSGWLITLNTVHHIGSPGADWPAEGIAIESGSNNTISWNKIYETGRHGIDLISLLAGSTVSNNIVQNNTIYNSYHTGIDMNNGGGTHSGNILCYNTIYADANYANLTIPCTGIYGDAYSGLAVDSVKIYYNLIYNLPGKGIQNGTGMVNTVIYNNTVANKNASFASWVEGIRIGATRVTGVKVKNNIAYGYDSAFTAKSSAALSKVDYNAWYSAGTKPFAQVNGISYHSNDQAAYKTATGYDTHGKWADPLFVSTSDFRLKSTSPCIDAGMDVSLTTDYDGNVVPVGSAPDIGAHECKLDGARLKTPTGVRIIN